ncbi:AraC family transcriptional regulator [Rhizobacter sp. Root1221]|nr:AraC family transcriptional regulator [Rhizobacter sp. Root1221]
MTPDLEVVQIGRAESFKAWEHGYPFRTVRWHFHPEFELHHVVATTGQYFVGDFIGTFVPGNLVLTGPHLPHNWVSDLADEATVPVRSRVLQFSERFITGVAEVLPELGAFQHVLDKSRSGALFTPEVAERVGPLLAALVDATDLRRIELFVAIIGTLSRAEHVQALTSTAYLPDPSGFMASGLNEALSYISSNLTDSFSEQKLASLSQLSTSGFSRSFRRHTGMSLVHYVNRLRINLSTQLLMSEPQMPITDVCYASGFRNISNFNRQFLRLKSMSPTQFRNLFGENAESKPPH